MQTRNPTNQLQTYLHTSLTNMLNFGNNEYPTKKKKKEKRKKKIEKRKKKLKKII